MTVLTFIDANDSIMFKQIDKCLKIDFIDNGKDP